MRTKNPHREIRGKRMECSAEKCEGDGLIASNPRSVPRLEASEHSREFRIAESLRAVRLFSLLDNKDLVFFLSLFLHFYIPPKFSL